MMRANNLTPDFLDDATPDDVAALTPDGLEHLKNMLADDAGALNRRALKLHDGMLIRYGERVKSELAPKAGVGTAHIDDGEYNVTVTVPKTVEWDQANLMDALAEMSDADAEHYAKYSLSVEERKFNAAPPAIQAKFAAARTIKAGKPKFEFKPRKQGAA
jgi:hypothetical protein